MKVFHLILILIWLTACDSGNPPPVTTNPPAPPVLAESNERGDMAASAAEVNDKFTAVESAVNDNDARITANTSNIQANTPNIQTNTLNIQANTPNIQTNTSNIQTNATSIQTNTSNISVIANKRPLGVYVDSVRLGDYLHGADGVTVTVLLDSGYYVKMHTQGGVYNTNVVYYEKSNCTGQEYVHSEGDIYPFLVRHGTVFIRHNVGDVYYIAAGTLEEVKSVGYSLENGKCIVGYINRVYKVYPYNQAVIGIPISNFNGTVTLGY
jgi:hypothetical protein